jgi:hypothetical protein
LVPGGGIEPPTRGYTSSPDHAALQRKMARCCRPTVR